MCRVLPLFGVYPLVPYRGWKGRWGGVRGWGWASDGCECTRLKTGVLDAPKRPLSKHHALLPLNLVPHSKIWGGEGCVG